MSKEVAVVDEVAAEYPALSQGADVAEILETNLGGDDFSPFELDQLKTPSGGGISWEIETLDGEIDTAKLIEGIIILTQLQRAFYEVEIDDGGGGNPPDCSSNDGVTGVGEPGGLCAECPYAQYGSAAKGEGQRCKQSRVMYVMLPGQYLPVALRVPASSLKAAKKYLLKLAGRGMPFMSVVTSFGLEKKKNADGITYSGITFSVSKRLAPASIEVVKDISKSFSQAVSK